MLKAPITKLGPRIRDKSIRPTQFPPEQFSTGHRYVWQNIITHDARNRPGDERDKESILQELSVTSI
jgi:hypothetical protein